MGSILAKIRKKTKKRTCFLISALYFASVLMFIATILSADDNITVGFFACLSFCCIIVSILFLAAGLYDPGPDESAIKQPRFYTLNQDGDIVLTEVEVSTPPSLDCTEICRADGRVDISMEIHSKEQAVEVLAALAVMYDKGDIAAADYHNNVRKIREHFNL